MAKSKKKKVYTGSVVGLDSSDQPITINFENTMKDYLDFNYDDIGLIEVEKLHSHVVIKSMITRLNEDIIFE